MFCCRPFIISGLEIGFESLPTLCEPIRLYTYNGLKTNGSLCVSLGPAKFDTTREHDTNPTLFLRVWVEYNRVWVIFVLTRLTRLINGSYSC